MAESTLALKYADLVGEVGLFLGFGRGAAFGDPAYTTQQQNAIDSCVKSGLRQFYYPPPVEGNDNAYDWSFLKPFASVALPTGAQVVPLYDDFGGVEGRVYIFAGKTTQWWALDLIGIGMIIQKYAELPTTSGRPIMIAVEPLKPTGPDHGQRHQFHVWPLADQPYTLQFQYYVQPDYLNNAFPYHMGTAIHAETVRAACLMAAEEYLDDAQTVWAMKFQERLLASISADRKLKPQTLGYNADNSDFRHRWNRGDQHGWSEVRVHGVQY